MTRHIFPKSPLTPLFQRGEFLPFLKGGQEGFNLQCLYNYGLTNNTNLKPLLFETLYYGNKRACGKRRVSVDHEFIYQSTKPMKEIRKGPKKEGKNSVFQFRGSMEKEMNYMRKTPMLIFGSCYSTATF